MDPSNSHQTNYKANNTTGPHSNSPPNIIWVTIPLLVVLLTGALIATTYRLVTTYRRRKSEEERSDPEQAATVRETSTAEVGGATSGGSHTTPVSDPEQPTDRWGWVFDPNGSGSSRGAARMSEGLNELGEAPPPYGVGPKSCGAEMVEVADGAGEGASGAVLLRGPGVLGVEGHRRRSEVGSEPPAYEMAVGSGEGVSPREPPPAVTPRSR